MIPIVDPAIAAYAAAHTPSAHPVYSWLKERTYADAHMPQMQVGHLEGRTLALLARLSGAKRAVEVGTFTGYSALAIAEGMGDGGHLITLDKDPVATAIATEAFGRAPWGDRIELRLGDAREQLAQIQGPIDFAFIDADKTGYIHYWDVLVDRLRAGGVIVVDNVLWSGRVLDPQDASDHAIVQFNRHAAADPRVDGVLLTVRDGLTVATKRG